MKNIFKELFKKNDENELELTDAEIKIREKIEKEFYFKAVWGIIFSAIFLVILFFTIFFINVDGEEDTKVPKLEGLKLHEAIIALQERALYPKLTVRNSTPNEKGLIINQDISAGSVVKAGRIIGITASLGGVIDSVGSYEGQSLKAVEAELQKLFSSSSSEPILVIDKPIEVISEEPVGTILSQDPPAGTEITDITKLTFHISKGKEVSSYQVPTMTSLTFEDGLKKITQWPIRYRFIVRKKKNREDAGIIVAQTPEKGITVPWTTVLEMTMTEPEGYPSNYSFGLLELVVPNYQVSVPMVVERVKNDGVKEIFVDSKTFGGPITVPYLEEVGTRLIISVDGVEIQSFIVRQL